MFVGPSLATPPETRYTTRNLGDSVSLYVYIILDLCVLQGLLLQGRWIGA